MTKERVFSDRLNLLDAKLDKILEILTADKQPGELNPVVSEPQTPIARPIVPIEVPGMEAPWVLKSLTWDGKSEVYDEEELKSFLGFNPNGNDPDGKPWCAGFLKKNLQECGIDTTGLDLSVMSFADFGYECEQVNGAIMVFQPKVDSKYRISHVGVKVEDDKLFGGNQGDSAKRSNLAWYMQHAELVACRCPEGYRLLA